MSSFANYHNHSPSLSISEFVNDDENEYNSSYNRQNESMMHKVKDVVSKLLHPSFLFSGNDEPNHSKRKRSISIEENNDEQQIDTTNAHITTSKYHRSLVKDNEPQLTDDEDNSNQDISSTEIEQQKKRRRTANYQNILSSNSHHNNERPSSNSVSIDSSTIEKNSNERINQLRSPTHRFNISSTYQRSTSNYDPSKSSLFSVDNRKTTTTNLNPNNHLLASSLITRPQLSVSNNKQSPPTLTNPITNNNRQLLTKERQIFGVNYASINSTRLSYIERLRRRTLQDCIRLNRTLDNEPLSTSTIEEHKSSTSPLTTTTTSSIPQRTKLPEKDCGIQCDILNETNKKLQHTFPPENIRNEVLLMPTVEKTQSSSQTDSPIQTNSSITIEKIQPTLPIIEITKPKVLGNITPFSWPKFARAQEEFSKKYPDKCTDIVPPKSVIAPIIEKSNVNTIPRVSQQTNTSTITKTPIYPSSSSRSNESIWKCPSCTKEHPAKTASCSLCHGINLNYKKLSATPPTVTVEKESVPSNKLPDVISKETNISVPTTTIPKQTTSTENIVSISPALNTNVVTPTFLSFGTTPITSLPVTTKENSIITTSSINPPFGTAPIMSFTATTTIENPLPTSTSHALASTTPIISSAVITKENPVIFTTPPSFGIATTKENSIFTNTPILFGTQTTKENPILTSASPLSFGTTPIASLTATTKENPVTTSAAFTMNTMPIFGTSPNLSIPITTKENPINTSTSPIFGTTPSDKTLNTSVINSFQIGTTFQPFPSGPSTSLTTAVTNSTVPSIVTVTPSMPTSLPQVSTSIPFGTFGNTPIITTTPPTPVISTASSNQFAPFTFTPTTSNPSFTTSVVTSPNVFGSLTTTSATATSSMTSFPISSTTNAFSVPNNSLFTSPTTSTVAPVFGTGGFNFTAAPTRTISSNSSFGEFGTGGIKRPFTPTTDSSTDSNSAPTFGVSSSFGTSSTLGDRPASSSLPFAFGSSNSTPPFRFGAVSNTTTNTTQVPAVSTSGFPFPSPSSTAPVFGASPSTLSSSGSFNTFSLGSSAAAAPTNNAPFQFSGTISTPITNSPFSTSGSSDAPVDIDNPYSISSTASLPSTTRNIIRGKRQKRP